MTVRERSPPRARAAACRSPPSTSSLDEVAERIVADWPPPTLEQRDILALLLRPTRPDVDADTAAGGP